MQNNRQKPLPGLILSIFLCSLAYWIYLAFATGMSLVNDAIGYEQLGRLLKDKGFIAYFQTGPNREPIYPMLVALSMHLEALSGLAYTKIMAFFGVLLLLCNQVLIYVLLRKLNVRLSICAVILAYTALSPAINNTAFSLYSEIASLPLILLLVYIAAHSFNVLKTPSIIRSLTAGSSLGAMFLATTMIKSIFELVFFLFIAFILGLLLKALWERKNAVVLNIIVLLSALVVTYQLPIHAYKMLNKHYNDHYAITNRGSWALYGGVALKTEPITGRQVMAAAAHVMGNGACMKFFPQPECDYWEAWVTSDSLGMKEHDAVLKSAPAKDVDNIILSHAKERILQKPLQFTFLSVFDWLKMFFWESTQIGYVEYPAWMAKLYSSGIFKDLLRLAVSFMTLAAFLYTVFLLRKKPLSLEEDNVRLSIFLVVLAYTGFHALFNSVTRWALPMAPLYIVLIGLMLEHLLPHRQPKK